MPSGQIMKESSVWACVLQPVRQLCTTRLASFSGVTPLSSGRQVLLQRRSSSSSVSAETVPTKVAAKAVPMMKTARRMIDLLSAPTVKSLRQNPAAVNWVEIRHEKPTEIHSFLSLLLWGGQGWGAFRFLRRRKNSSQFQRPG